MPQEAEPKYSFVTGAAPKDAFIVVRFKGEEGLSRPYRFEIDLMSDRADLDLDGIMDETATLTIHRQGGDVPFKGIVTDLELGGSWKEFVFYRAVLIPKFQWLDLTSHNQIFLDKALPDILTEVLEDGGLTTNDFELRLQDNYEPWEYVCQYQESHLNFVSRWMERDGLYYWFEQGDDGEKLIISDMEAAESFMPQGKTAAYAQPSGLDGAHIEETVRGFFCRQRPTPADVYLSDYNYRRPSLRIEGRATVSDQGQGTVHLHGHHARTPEEADKLAAVRAEELLCHSREFSGESSVPFLRPGYQFELKDHFRDDYNQKYLTVSVEHKGSQTAFVISGLGLDLPGAEPELYYQNSFTAIEEHRRFRPARITQRPKIYGAMNAMIDAEGSGTYAELDEMGRYKAILPFDQSGRKNGKASAWLRMMQPYAGENHGMHFPLHKGTEVLLHFLDGNPDRPIIVGAVPNPENPSMVTSDNQTMNAITTSSDNKIHVEDQKGSERILMHSPKAQSFVRIGAPNDPHDDDIADKRKFKFAQEEKDGIKLVTGQGLDIRAGTYNSVVMGEKISVVVGLEGFTNIIEKVSTIGGHGLNGFLGLAFEFQAGWHWVARNDVTEMHWFKKKVAGEKWDIATAKTKIQEMVQEGEGDVTDAIGNANTAIEELNDVTGEADTAKGEVNDAIAVANFCKGKMDDAIGEANDAKGEVNEAVSNANKATGELNRVTGAANRAIGNINKASAGINSTSAEVTRINTQDTTV
jgi:type VI secretion system secreted protein VgrG